MVEEGKARSARDTVLGASVTVSACASRYARSDQPADRYRGPNLGKARLGTKITLDEAKRRASHPLMTPDAIPGNPEFDGVWTGNDMFVYWWKDHTFIEFTPSDGIDYSTFPAERRIQVRGKPGIIGQFNSRRMVGWIEGEWKILLGGLAATRTLEELVQIANSLRRV